MMIEPNHPGLSVVGPIARLFQHPTRYGPDKASRDIAPTGEGIVGVELIRPTSSEPLVLIQNWQSLLDR